MTDQVYRQLLEVMQKRGGTYAGKDIPEFYAMVEELFTPAEAAVNNALPRGPVTAKDLAQALGREETEVRETLEQMASKGLCMAFRTEEGTQLYQGARFMPGILEYQFVSGRETEREKKLAKLIGAYEKACEVDQEAAPINFPTSRVITVDARVEAGNTVHTYDQVRAYIDKYEAIAVGTCYCRHAAELRGEDIHGLPKDVCMTFGAYARFNAERLGARLVTKAEAREVMDRAEKAGLIHMSQNVTEDLAFICNCDRWHCVAVTEVLAQPKPGLVFNSGFQPHFDAELCTVCGVCLDRCPPGALAYGEDDVPTVNLDRCFGCAVCATGCAFDAITMVSKPGFAPPPRDAKALRAAAASSRS